MKSKAHAFARDAKAALDDTNLQAALANLKKGFQVKRAQAFEMLGDPEGLRDAGAAIRTNALVQLPELLELFERNVVAAGGHVHWARNAREARELIAKLLKERKVKTVTKGKSMVTEEIELNPYLEAQGITPVETDLGEYIIQLRDEAPSHIVAPAFHLRKEDVEESFREAHVKLNPSRTLEERAALVAEARGILRQKFLAADAGITGANFLVAESGTAVIVTNEGNGDLTRILPPLHIVVTGIEKVVPRLDDVPILLRLLTRSATGQDITSYVTLASSPRQGDDADGPEEFHVVLVDNGRSDILGSPAHEVLKCIRCGACLNHCPVYGAVGGHAYGTVYPGPIGAALDPALDGIRDTHHLPSASSFCGRCEDVCPVKIPLTRIMRHWRNKAFEDGLTPPGMRWGLRIWGWLARAPRLYGIAAGLRKGQQKSYILSNRTRLVRISRLAGSAAQELSGTMASGKKMTARAQILAKLKAANASELAKSSAYRRKVQSDPNIEFVARAEAADGVVYELAAVDDLPAKMQSLYSRNGETVPLHIAPGSSLRELPWGSAPKLILHDTAPGSEAVALSAADFAIAETGTLVFLSGTARPSSWHFLPGVECVLVRRTIIVPALEDLFAKLAGETLPATLNLVTGPSRTADIEQTIERGAHGPRALHIFLTAN